MKTLSIPILAALVAAPLSAQDDLQKNLAKKLESEFLKKNEWFTDFDKARAQAKKSQRVIFGYFTRSYAP